jgi:transcriptional regulator with XRE-family HTH domain
MKTMKNSRLIVGQVISNARKTRNLNQWQLAKLLGVTQPYISSIENGRANITIDQVEDILELLDYRIDIQLKPLGLTDEESQKLDRVNELLLGTV